MTAAADVVDERFHEIDDRQANFGLQLVDEGMADETRQDQRIDLARLETADHVENVELAAVLTGRTGARRIAFDEGMLLENEFGLMLASGRGDRAHQLEENVGGAQRTEAADDAVAPSLTFDV